MALWQALWEGCWEQGWGVGWVWIYWAGKASRWKVRETLFTVKKRNVLKEERPQRGEGRWPWPQRWLTMLPSLVRTPNAIVGVGLSKEASDDWVAHRSQEGSKQGTQYQSPGKEWGCHKGGAAWGWRPRREPPSSAVPWPKEGHAHRVCLWWHGQRGAGQLHIPATKLVILKTVLSIMLLKLFCQRCLAMETDYLICVIVIFTYSIH